jgi:predicted nucleic acid binding AN1-type Zn finger protein
MDLNIQALLRGLTPNLGPTTVDTQITLEAPVEPKNRCGVCRKKLKLTDLECRCSARFCANHRPPEEHACTYDYKTAGRTQLSKNLEKAVADKVERI